jgi:hypothetical protein
MLAFGLMAQYCLLRKIAGRSWKKNDDDIGATSAVALLTVSVYVCGQCAVQRLVYKFLADT